MCLTTSILTQTSSHGGLGGPKEAYNERPESAVARDERSGLSEIAEKVFHGERLSVEDGALLFDTPHVHAVGALANWVREQRHGDLTYFNRNLHINATNVCEADCIFCSFSRLKTGDAAAYTA